MALWTTKLRTELGNSLVLAPERYDPRRERLRVVKGGVRFRDVIRTIGKTVSPAKSASEDKRYLVLDTSDAREGIVVARKLPVGGSEVGSAKKRLQPNQVIISRLRPYLRQVALIDDGISGWSSEVGLVCSTEFFVLESSSADSIAFLVPYLLSSPVQEVLAASQEGGHHPRFSEAVLLNLPIPPALLKNRDELSREVEASVRMYRQSERLLANLVEIASKA